ncbi:ABC transporter ATP-binding protein [Enterobacter sp. 10-1]|uniref:dipeptide ABC transporter ATP-binding protein n=1 Tax=Raoultella sp. 10-1 TaxID=2683201 RepID=UPI000BA3F931|nr:MULTISPECIES: ABC transporter ATP-binding protein [Enterobacteriaceae]MVT03003.1 dipeptide ABC transporter ATP-binding protein [Raoultella sp. 10-1]PAC12410.1 ABC transporter ATP-binding protein [Enterobacter sp. 10-1]
MPLLNVRDLTIGLDPRSTLVKGVSFHVEPGETLAVVGESGSGKSLSLLAVLGLLPTQMRVQGEIVFNDQPLHAFTANQKRQLRGAQIGYVSQDPLSNLHPLKSVGRQIEEAILAHRRVGRKALRTQVLSLLAEVGIADAARRYHERPAKFSGGQRQRVMIAIAIALNPSLIIADEPTTALDATVQASILRLLKRLQRQHGCALVFISHNLRVVADIADRIVVMQHGQVVEQGAARALFDAPQHDYTRSLLQAGWHPRAPSPFRYDEATPLLEVSQVSRSFVRPSRLWPGKAAAPVLDGISFSLHEGEILGLVGESGSGKSTLGRIVVGLDRPDGGTLTLAGQPWKEPGSHHPERHAVQMVFQDPYSSLNPRRRVDDTLAQPLQLTALRERGQPLSPLALRAAIDDLLAQVELPALAASRYPSQLSGGQRQRVVIARALAMKPKLIVADEAVSALDITTQHRIIQLFIRLRSRYGLSLLFISHDLDAVAALCDRVLVLQAGHIIEQGSTEQIFQRPQHAWTRLLLAAIPGTGHRFSEEVVYESAAAF